MKTPRRRADVVDGRGPSETLGETDGALALSPSPADDRVLEALRRLAVAVDGACPGREPAEGDLTGEVWSALVSGRWTVLDHFDRGGRRYWIAQCNEPSIAASLALTTRERQVVTRAALGHSNKRIAYELGLSTSTVATHLGVAMGKLGVCRRTDLVSLLVCAVEAALHLAP